MILSIKCMRLLANKQRVAQGLIVTLGLVYPVIVYYGLRVFSYQTIGMGLLALLLVRVVVAGKAASSRREQLITVVTIACVMVLFYIDPAIAVKAYPVIINLILALVFAYSLIMPPSAVERIARLTDPDLGEAGQRYTRKVTFVWLVFFMVNGIIAGFLALYGSIEQWTLYNGFIAYLMIGTLFGAELLVRRFVKNRHN